MLVLFHQTLQIEDNDDGKTVHVGIQFEETVY